MQDNKLYKAFYNCIEKCLTIYNEYDEIVIRKNDVPLIEMKKIEKSLLSIGAKRIDQCSEAFTYVNGI